MKASKFLKSCEVCNIEFFAIPSKVKVGKDRFCSKTCYSKTLIGKRVSPKTIFKSENVVGSKNVNWKGKEAKYGTLHDWVYYHAGRPKSCSYCGAKHRMLHWANKSGKYKRDLSDWVALCVPHHKLYDLGKLELESPFQDTFGGFI